MSENKRIVRSFVEKNFEDTRIDQFLSDKFEYHSRKQWQALIKDKIILINGKPCKNSKKIKCGDIVEFIVDNFEEPECNTNYSISYEDRYLLAVNKPPNCIIHPVGPFFKNTLTYQLKEDLGFPVFSVNRLDRETTGLVLFGKNPKTAKLLSEYFIKKTIYKEYIVAVHGIFPDNLHAKGYLLNDEKSQVRKKRKFQFNCPKNLSEKEFDTAETFFEHISTNNNISLVKVLLKTGRLHQIRATLCSLKYPVVGDKLYGLDDTMYLHFIEKKLTDSDNRKLIIDHQALHARKIQFIHPNTQEELIIEAPTPKEIISLIS